MLRLLSGFVIAGVALGAPAKYEIDASHSITEFSVRHLMVTNVKGTFSKMSGTAVWDPANLAACSLEAVIDVNSVDTRHPKRDADLKGTDFFDTAKYPRMTFRSTRVSRSGDKLQVTGDLTMHGVTKAVVLDVEGPSPEVKDARGLMRIGATATTKISRKEFGLTYNPLLESGGVTIGDEVKITIEVELIRK